MSFGSQTKKPEAGSIRATCSCPDFFFPRLWSLSQNPDAALPFVLLSTFKFLILLSYFLLWISFKVLTISLSRASIMADLYCSAPNLSPTPTELCQWTTVQGSIIIHIPTLYSLLLLLLLDSHLLPRPIEKIQLLGSHNRY